MYNNSENIRTLDHLHNVRMHKDRSVYPEVPITADNSSAEELLDYLDISSNYVEDDRLLPFDTTIHTSNQLSGIILSDNPDIDPDYMPVETSDSEQSDVPKTVGCCIQKALVHTPGLDEDIYPIKERKLILREKKDKKRVRNTSEWIDVKAKKDLNLAMEHKNRKGKLILAKQMKEPCKEECRNRSREKISQDNRQSLSVYPEVPITADNSSAEELLDYLDISSNYVEDDRLLPFDTTIHTSNQLSGIILSDNPDIDPDYMPVGTSDSEQSDVPKTVGCCIQKALVHTPGLDEDKYPIKEVQVCRKRKLILREKKDKKRVRNTSEWIDVKAKKDLNLAMEHKNRKGKLILAKQMKEPCKEECRNRSREKISQDNRQSLHSIGLYIRLWTQNHMQASNVLIVCGYYDLT
nr:unnamed protein product [Callosobruchus analis]